VSDVSKGSGYWRYSRQTVFEGIGFEGQEKLRQATVAVVGLGGLGSAVAMSLSGMGVGRLILVDYDTVAVTDLHRQLLYTEEDVGRSKVAAARRRLRERNSVTVIDERCEYVDEANAPRILRDADVVVDCLDNFLAKFSLSRACASIGKVLVFGSALEDQGVAGVFRPKDGACIECVYPGMAAEALPTCATAGVLPPVLGVVASVQVAETVRLIVSGTSRLFNRLLFVDLDGMSFDTLAVFANPECPAVLGIPLPQRAGEPEQLCARESRRLLMVRVRPRLPLDRVRRVAERTASVEVVDEHTLTFRLEGEQFVYTDAGVLFGDFSPESSFEHAKSVLEELIQMFRQSAIQAEEPSS
jgi:molybdopterin/thiamine biosynthesis adenylyltransferase